MSALPDGYATAIGERGYSLSGGQRQRIAIARAILADPRVLILDDATSAVDPTKEHEIRDALTEVMRGRTTIVIAHRPATIALADRVVLIGGGRVVAEGTHAELLATDARYRQVLAAAAQRELAGNGQGGTTARPRRRGGGVVAMWMQGGVSDEDRLDRVEARRVLRRTARMLSPSAGGWPSPWPRSCCGPAPCWPARTWCATASTTASPTGTPALNLAVAGYVVVAILAYFTYRTQIALISRVGEEFLRACGSGCSTTCNACRCRSTTGPRPACWCPA